MPELLEDVIAKMGVLSATQKHLEVLQCYRDECGGDRPRTSDFCRRESARCQPSHPTRSNMAVFHLEGRD
ncbi:hypothetical protein WJX72_008866 [[Myrmecia] bisecta]|uniref:Uncharacterized protein n=1 Tax=[Myrmecia] bisecta TaxID=41462 RepID=A0AAW1QBX7_9CHLO